MHNHIKFLENWKSLIFVHCFLFICILLWISPLTHTVCKQMDSYIFTLLNSSLIGSTYLQSLFGLFNHRLETKLNLVFAVIINILAILATHNKNLRKIRLLQYLYFWACFQIGFMFQDWILHTVLHLERLSPSLMIEPAFQLSEVLNDPNIKDRSLHSFPSGHAFSMIFWGTFTFLSSPRYIGVTSLMIGIFLSTARLFSGAHWFSDVAFSSILALCWLTWTLHTPIYQSIKKKQEAVLSLC